MEAEIKKRGDRFEQKCNQDGVADIDTNRWLSVNGLRTKGEET